MNQFELHHFADEVAIAKAAAEHWLNAVNQSAQHNQLHLVALSGGRIAKTLFSEIVEQTVARNLSLGHVHFFWADERCVAPTDPESSFKIANDFLFQPLKITRGQIHRLKGELSPEIALMDANIEILRTAPTNSRGEAVLDFIFLGMGEDGHVASLFPNSLAKNITRNEAYVFVRNSPKPPPQRISLSYGAIAAAPEVVVLISGSGKSEALQKSLEKSGETPLAKVLKSRSVTKIYTDIPL